MIETSPERPAAERIAPVLCALCLHPVSHMGRDVAGARAGGLCTRCRHDRHGNKQAVYTFEVVVDSKP